MFIKLPGEYINVDLIVRIQILPGNPPIVRVVWVTGKTWVYEHEDAIAFCQALHNGQIPVAFNPEVEI